MEHGFRFTNRPYDIRERVLQFVIAITAIYPRGRTLDRPSYRSWAQLFDAASSTGAHLEEAEASTTKRHFRGLIRGALREMREAKYWLRIIAVGKLEGWQTLGELPDEASQLVAILTTIVKNSS
jgi:four helix bundle protein